MDGREEVVVRDGTCSPVIHRLLVDGTPFWTATHDLAVRTVDGVRIGTAASWFLEELNAQDAD